MKSSFRSDLMSSVRIGGNISKIDKLKEDIIDILSNSKLKVAKFLSLKFEKILNNLIIFEKKFIFF